MIKLIPAAYFANATLKPYIWRDPARLSAQELADLAAHDAHIAALNGEAPSPVQASASQAERQQAFADARRDGLSVREAAARAGVSYRTGVSYEQRRHGARRRR